MWHDEKKHYLINGARINQIIITLQMISDKFPELTQDESKKELIRTLTELNKSNRGWE